MLNLRYPRYAPGLNFGLKIFFILLSLFCMGECQTSMFQVFILKLWSFNIMVLKRDLRSYFAKSDNAKVKSNSQKDEPNASYFYLLCIKYNRWNWDPASTAGSMKSCSENIPLKIKDPIKHEIGNYTTICGAIAAIDCFSKIYAKFSLKRTLVNACMKK